MVRFCGKLILVFILLSVINNKLINREILFPLCKRNNFSSNNAIGIHPLYALFTFIDLEIQKRFCKRFSYAKDKIS